MPIGPRLPLTTTTDKLYNEVDIVVDEVKQNLKNILLTAPGEKAFDSNFGVGLKRYLFENFDNVEYQVQAAIKEKVRRYARSVIIQDISFEQDKNNNSLYLLMRFGIEYVPGEFELGLTVTNE
jgi:phage baseplate assembly protein W